MDAYTREIDVYTREMDVYTCEMDVYTCEMDVYTCEMDAYTESNSYLYLSSINKNDAIRMKSHTREKLK